MIKCTSKHLPMYNQFPPMSICLFYGHLTL
uniref:Uncharacterized protein n=1 Tax=Arundo donax TaxID=35708 RepID=A0A0A9F1B0_ARUDO